jgi:hypothetical protein
MVGISVPPITSETTRSSERIVRSIMRVPIGSISSVESATPEKTGVLLLSDMISMAGVAVAASQARAFECVGSDRRETVRPAGGEGVRSRSVVRPQIRPPCRRRSARTTSAAESTRRATGWRRPAWVSSRLQTVASLSARTWRRCFRRRRRSCSAPD